MRTYPSHTPPNKICKGGGLVRTTLPSLDRLAEAEAGRRGRTWDKWVGADHDDDDVMMSVQVGADHDDVMMSVLDKWVGADLHCRSNLFLEKDGSPSSLYHWPLEKGGRRPRKRSRNIAVPLKATWPIWF